MGPYRGILVNQFLLPKEFRAQGLKLLEGLIIYNGSLLLLHQLCSLCELVLQTTDSGRFHICVLLKKLVSSMEYFILLHEMRSPSFSKAQCELVQESSGVMFACAVPRPKSSSLSSMLSRKSRQA